MHIIPVLIDDFWAIILQQQQQPREANLNVVFPNCSVQRNLGLSSITKQQRRGVWTDQIAVAAGTGRL